MAYSVEIANLLAKQLERLASLNRHQLAGQVANLDFRVAEVIHCRGVLDGYRTRFGRMKAAQTEYVSTHKTVAFDLRDPDIAQSAPPPRPVPDADFKQVRRSLNDAAYRLLIRCQNEAGFLAFLLCGIPMASVIHWGETAFNPKSVPEMTPFYISLVCAGVATGLAAIAESLPSRVNDNVRVGVTAAIATSLLHGALVGWHAFPLP